MKWLKRLLARRGNKIEKGLTLQQLSRELGMPETWVESAIAKMNDDGFTQITVENKGLLKGKVFERKEDGTKKG